MANLCIASDEFMQYGGGKCDIGRTRQIILRLSASIVTSRGCGTTLTCSGGNHARQAIGPATTESQRDSTKAAPVGRMAKSKQHQRPARHSRRARRREPAFT